MNHIAKKSRFIAMAAIVIGSYIPSFGVFSGAANARSNSVKTEFGVQASSIESFFESSIANGDTRYQGKAKKINSKDLEAAKAYVWDIWKEAVRNEKGERLPPLSSHPELENWLNIENPDGVWQFPDGEMKFFYGTKGEMPENGYPLFLFIHGSGDDNQREWTVSLSWAQRFKDGDVAYFVPRSPNGGTGTRWFPPSRQEKWERIIRQAFVSDSINPAKFYIMGISEGGYGSQRLGSFYSDYLAGAGPIAGGEILYNCPPENLANTAFTLQTGEEDIWFGRKLLTQRVAHLLDSLQTAHPGLYEHKVNLQPGRGHGCDYTVTTPWLVTHERNARPKYVKWENYGMGGVFGEPIRYRDSFYNLHILQPSDPRDNDMYRTVYEMQIDGNTVNLKVDNVTLTPTEHTDVNGFAVPLTIKKDYTTATSGKVRIYLDDQLVDLSKPVEIIVNGKIRFRGKVTTDLRNIIESCAIFFDPMRLYPASVDVEI